MSLTEEQRARMERMKKVAQEKKKWKDKATQGGGGGNSGAASGGQAPFASGGSGVALQAVQSVPISRGGQGGGFQKAPYTTSDISSVASMSSYNGSGRSNHQSSTAARPIQTFCEGGLATKGFYKPQAAQPPLPRGNFRPQEQPSAFKHQAPSKVFIPIT